MVLLLSVGVLEIRTIGEFDPKRRTSHETTMQLEPSTLKLKDVCVRPVVSLEDKVYPKTYYHRNHDDI